MKKCYQGISNPSPTETEKCGGCYISTDCTQSPEANPVFDLPEGYTQTQMNAAVTSALVYKQQQIEDLEAIDNKTYIEAGDNIEITGEGTENNPFVITALNTRPYKILTGLISQNSTDAPTLIIYENNTGYTITTEYFSTGIYFINLEDPLNELPIPFPDSNAWCIIADDVAGSSTSIFVNSTERLIIKTYNSSNIATNSLLYERTFEVRLYN